MSKYQPPTGIVMNLDPPRPRRVTTAIRRRFGPAIVIGVAVLAGVTTASSSEASAGTVVASPYESKIIYDVPTNLSEAIGLTGFIMPVVSCFRGDQAYLGAWVKASSNYPAGTSVAVQWLTRPWGSTGNWWVTGPTQYLNIPYGRSASLPVVPFKGSGSYQIGFRIWWTPSGAAYSASRLYEVVWNNNQQYTYYAQTTYVSSAGWNGVQTSSCTL